MPEFRYTARRYVDGTKVSGRHMARDRADLGRWLDEQALYPLKVKETVSRTGGRAVVNPYALAVFCREVAGLLEAGLPVLNVLQSISKQSADRQLQQLVHGLVKDIEGGSTLSESWRQHCLTFNEIGTAVIAAGEASGRLPTMLLSLAGYLEESIRLRELLTGMLWYPAILALTAISMTTLFVVVVLPKFAMMLEALNVPLPLLTRIVLGTAHFVGSYWWLLAGAAAGVVMIVTALLKHPVTRLRWDQYVLRFPVVGELLILNATYRFAHTSGVLLESGLTATEAFDTTGGTIPNRYIRGRLAKATTDMASGSTISEAISAQNLFFPLAAEMVHVGEQSGQLPELLKHLASFCQESLSRKVKRLSVLLEPAIIVPMAGLVATLIASMLLPYFKLVETIR